MALFVGLIGCGDDDGPPARIPGLQTEQFSLVGQICQRPGELRDERNRAEQAQARRQVVVLIRALRERPEARVRTSYASHSGPGSEILTVRELAKREAYSDQGLQVALDATQAPTRCVMRLRTRIQRAIDASG